MDKYLKSPKTKSRSAAHRNPSTPRKQKDKMAPPLTPSDHSQSEDEMGDPGHYKIAEAVARILTPTIQQAVDAAVAKGIRTIRQEMQTQAKRITATETRISSLEDGAQTQTTQVEVLQRTVSAMASKLDDIENRSRRNNLRILGIPEAIRPAKLAEICSNTLPGELGITHLCKVERAHRLGQPQPSRTTPRPVIVKYLDYTHKAAILRAYRQQKGVSFEGHKLLIFADYSAEVSGRRKEFNKACAWLVSRKIRFMLAYPAILRFQAPDGSPQTFDDPEKALTFLQTVNVPNVEGEAG